MNLLLTGAFKYSEKQIEQLSKLGHNLTFVPDERIPLDINCTKFEAVICNSLFLYTPIEKFTSLKYIQLTSAGFDRVPMDYLREKNISVFNAKGAYSIPMAEWAVLKVLELYKSSRFFEKNQAQHLWEKKRDLQELYGKTVCIIGTGNIGMECIKRFKCFGTEIIGVDIFNNESNLIDNFFYTDNVNDALKLSDIVILTLPLTEKTKGMVNTEFFENMKNESVLVNISRGAVINTNDLISALNSGKLYGAALDVFENEPIENTSPLWDFENVIITPHNSFVSVMNNKRLFNIILTNLSKF